MEITRKVFSFCEHFIDLDHSLGEYPSNCYVEYTANKASTLKAGGYSKDEVANKLIELGALENEKVLIEIDY